MLISRTLQGFLVGAILPVIPWYLYKRTGRPIWRQINIPLVLHGVRRALFPTTAETVSTDPSWQFTEHRPAPDANECPRAGLPRLVPESVLRAPIPTALVRQGEQAANKLFNYLAGADPTRMHTPLKYNYTLSAALDAGTSVQAIVVYLFALENLVPYWWANSPIDSEHCIPGS